MEFNDLAVMVRSWLDDSGQTVLGLIEALKPDDFADQTVPARHHVYKMLSGAGIRMDFVEAVARYCFDGEQMFASLGPARALWNKAKTQPTPVTVAGLDGALAVSEQRVAALEKITSLQEALRVAQGSAYQAHQVAFLLLGMFSRQQELIGDLQRELAGHRAAAGAPNPLVRELETQLERAQAQQQELAEHVQHAERERDHHKGIAAAATVRIRQLEEQLHRLSEPEEQAAPLPAPITGPADPVSEQLDTVDAALSRAREILDLNRDRSDTAALEAGLDLPAPPFDPHRPTTVAGEVLHVAQLSQTTADNLPTSNYEQASAPDSPEGQPHQDSSRSQAGREAKTAEAGAPLPTAGTAAAEDRAFALEHAPPRVGIGELPDGLARRDVRDVPVRIKLAEAAFGAVRQVEFSALEPCQPCDGQGRLPLQERTCDHCNGDGWVQAMPSLGDPGITSDCRQCGMTGRVINSPKCQDCDGEGQIRHAMERTVKIPAGVRNSARIPLYGDGQTDPGFGPQFIEIIEQPHRTLERHGDDLHCTVTVPTADATTGTKVPMKTLDGRVEIDIPPGTQPGDAITLPGYGVQHLGEPGRGDLVAHVHVETPKIVRRLLERMRATVAVPPPGTSDPSVADSGWGPGFGTVAQ